MDHAANITAYFTDIATRHPDIQHSANNVRFRELEWEEMMQEGGSLGLPGFYCILEEYTNHFADSLSDYPVIQPVAALLLVRAYEPGHPTDKMDAFQQAERIALSIVQKVRIDAENGGCDADVPAGVHPPRALELKGTSTTRVLPPMWLNSAGVRLIMPLRYDIPLKSYAIAWPAL
jgi:hypothetical protein